MVTNVAVDDARWLRSLACWSLPAGLAYLVLFLLFFAEFPLMQNSSLPDAYNDLVLATRSAALTRVSIILSMSYWLLIGGFFMIAGSWLSRLVPVRGVFMMSLGAGQLLGVFGNVLQMNSLGDTAASYVAASADQQAILLRPFADLRLVYTSGFEVSGILWAVALLLLANVTWSVGVFPRWLSLLIAFGGAVALVNFAVILIAGKYDAPVMAELLLMVTFFATPIGLWRARPAYQPA